MYALRQKPLYLLSESLLQKMGIALVRQLQLFAKLMTVAVRKKQKQTFDLAASRQRLPSSESILDIFDVARVILIHPCIR